MPPQKVGTGLQVSSQPSPSVSVGSVPNSHRIAGHSHLLSSGGTGPQAASQ